jgi:hypothetical protein
MDTHAAIEDLLEAGFYNQCAGEDQQQLAVSQLDRVWSDSSQSRQVLKYDHESLEIEDQELLCWRGPAAN